MKARLILQALSILVVSQALISCASEEPKRRERVPPPVADGGTLPWNRPPKWEGNAKYGSMMPGSR